MALVSVTPISGSIVSTGQIITVVADETSTLVYRGSTGSTYTILVAANGTYEPGYTGSVTTAGNITYAFRRDAGWANSPFTITVRDGSTGSVVSTINYTLLAEGQYPPDMQPFNDPANGPGGGVTPGELDILDSGVLQGQASDLDFNDNLTVTVVAGVATIDAQAGSGDISGPITSTDHAIPRWDGTGGDTLLDSDFTIDDGPSAVLRGNAASFDTTVTVPLLLTDNQNVQESISIKETAAAGSDTPAWGRIWVRSGGTQKLIFRDDNGLETSLTDGIAGSEWISNAGIYTPVSGTNPPDTAGQMYVNNTDIHLTTQLKFYEADVNQIDQGIFLDELVAGDIIRLDLVTGATRFPSVYSLDSTPSFASNVYTCAVTFVSGSSLSWTGGDQQFTIHHFGLVNILNATSAPDANDDASDTGGNGFFTVGSRWVDTTNDEEYVCLDSTATAAVWKVTTFTVDTSLSLESVINSASPDNDVNVPLTDPVIFRDGNEDITPLSVVKIDQTVLSNVPALAVTVATESALSITLDSSVNNDTAEFTPDSIVFDSDAGQAASIFSSEILEILGNDLHLGADGAGIFIGVSTGSPPTEIEFVQGITVGETANHPVAPVDDKGQFWVNDAGEPIFTSASNAAVNPGTDYDLTTATPLTLDQVITVAPIDNALTVPSGNPLIFTDGNVAGLTPLTISKTGSSTTAPNLTLENTQEADLSVLITNAATGGELKIRPTGISKGGDSTDALSFGGGTTSTAAGNVFLTGISTSATTKSGDVRISGGDGANGTSGDGGDVVINGGAPLVSGTDGDIRIGITDTNEIVFGQGFTVAESTGPPLGTTPDNTGQFWVNDSTSPPKPYFTGDDDIDIDLTAGSGVGDVTSSSTMGANKLIIGDDGAKGVKEAPLGSLSDAGALTAIATIVTTGDITAGNDLISTADVTVGVDLNVPSGDIVMGVGQLVDGRDVSNDASVFQGHLDTVTGNPHDVEGLEVLSTGQAEFLVLTADGVDGTTWSSAGVGNVISALDITDHTIVRGDGGVKGVQESGIAISDTDDITGVVDLTMTGDLEAVLAHGVDNTTTPGGDLTVRGGESSTNTAGDLFLIGGDSGTSTDGSVIINAGGPSGAINIGTSVATDTTIGQSAGGSSVLNDDIVLLTAGNLRFGAGNGDSYIRPEDESNTGDNINIIGGTSTASTFDGGDVILRGGGTIDASEGDVTIGDASTANVNIGATGITTAVAGPLTAAEGVGVTGDITVTGEVDGIDVGVDVAANTMHSGLTDDNPHGVNFDNLLDASLVALNNRITEADVNFKARLIGIGSVSGVPRPASTLTNNSWLDPAIGWSVYNGASWDDVPAGTESNNLETATNGIAANEIPVGTGASVSTYTPVDTNTVVGRVAGNIVAAQLVEEQVGDDEISYAKMQNVVTDNRLLGTNSGAGTVVEELDGTKVTAMLNVATTSLAGLGPARTGGASTDYLSADGTYSVPAGGSAATLSKSFTIEDPSGTEITPLFVTDVAITITKVYHYAVGTSPDIDWNLPHGTDPTSGANTFTSEITTDTTTTIGSETTGFSDATVAAGEAVLFDSSGTPTGTIDALHLTIVYTED